MQRGSRSNRVLDYWVGVPLLNLLATFRRRHLPPDQIRKIGMMCSPALGDTLLFSGALQDVRLAFPEAHITHICMRQNLAAAELIPGADARLVIDLKKPWLSTRQLRAQSFDLLLDFTSWQRLTAFYTLMSGARYTVGFSTPGQKRSRAYDRSVPHRNERHELENFRALLDESGIAPGIEHHAPRVLLDPHISNPFAGETDVILLHPWASGQRAWLREWPESRWIALAGKLATGTTLFVISGAPSDRERMEVMVRTLTAAGLRTTAFVSPDGFRTLTQILRAARLVVSVNTGVMHLAAIAGARVVAINGPNSNLRWGPVGPSAVGVEAQGEGCGYLHLGFEFDNNLTDCMQRTTVEQVYTAAHMLTTAASETHVAQAVS
jgi:heptosyltransferase-3